MALIVEDGSIVTGANSFLSVADANAYFEARGESDWTGEDSAKEAALILATDHLCQHYRWKGAIVETDQPLCWPRSGVVDHEGRAIDKAEIPTTVQRACAELALRALDDELEPDMGGTGNLSRVTIAGVLTAGFQGQPSRPRHHKVDNLLRGLILANYTRKVNLA